MKCPALTLSLLLAACRTPGPEQQALLELPVLVDELRAAVIEELGADHSDGEYQLAWSEDLVAWAGIARFPAGPALVVREDWGLLSPAWKRLSIAHELVHLHGPQGLPFPLREGLANLLALRVEPELEVEVWHDHWLALLDCTVPVQELLSAEEPVDPELEPAVRAAGYMALRSLPDPQLRALMRTGEVGEVFVEQTSPRLWALAIVEDRPRP